MKLTCIHREIIKVQREIAFGMVQQPINLRQQGFKDIADVSQLGLREFRNETIHHPEEAVADVVGGGGGDLDHVSFSWGAAGCRVDDDHGDSRSERKVESIKRGCREEVEGNGGSVV